jgi:hypothetical protein
MTTRAVGVLAGASLLALDLAAQGVWFDFENAPVHSPCPSR